MIIVNKTNYEISYDLILKKILENKIEINFNLFIWNKEKALSFLEEVYKLKNRVENVDLGVVSIVKISQNEFYKVLDGLQRIICIYLIVNIIDDITKTNSLDKYLFNNKLKDELKINKHLDKTYQMFYKFFRKEISENNNVNEFTHSLLNYKIRIKILDTNMKILDFTNKEITEYELINLKEMIHLYISKISKIPINEDFLSDYLDYQLTRSSLGKSDKNNRKIDETIEVIISKYNEINKQSFSVLVLNELKKKGLSEPDFYNKAQIHRETWRKNITENGNPSFETAAKIIISLDLGIEKSEKIFNSAGFSLNSPDLYLICIKESIIDRLEQYEIDEMLYKLNLKTLFTIK